MNEFLEKALNDAGVVTRDPETNELLDGVTVLDNFAKIWWAMGQESQNTIANMLFPTV